MILLIKNVEDNSKKNHVMSNATICSNKWFNSLNGLKNYIIHKYTNDYEFCNEITDVYPGYKFKEIKIHNKVEFYYDENTFSDYDSIPTESEFYKAYKKIQKSLYENIMKYKIYHESSMDQDFGDEE